MSKNYANEHPKYKKLPESKAIKLAKYKGNGKIGDRFMRYYNEYISLGDSPIQAFEAAERAIYIKDYFKQK